MKISLFHFSDSHWISTWTNPITKKEYKPESTVSQFYSTYIKAFKGCDLSKYYGDKTYFIHTGDFANFYGVTKADPGVPIQDQFNHIKTNHLSTFHKKFRNANGFLAVPGNHDVDIDVSGDAKFNAFYSAFGKKWKLPFRRTPTTQVVRCSITGFNNKKLAIYLFNSASSVGQFKVGDVALSPASVTDDDMIPPEDTDYFRIAVLHHNLLPHYGQVETPRRDDVFINNGNFNLYLGQNNFKLVLSGHQHLGNEMFFAVPDKLHSIDLARPTLESTILSLAAPSFLRGELVTEIGFNLVEIYFDPTSNFTTLQLTKFRYNREQQEGFKAIPGSVFQILMPRIEKVHEATQDQRQRIVVARKVIDRFYDKNFDLTPISQLLSQPLEDNHFESIRRELNIRQRRPNNVVAMYSVAVLRPEFWWQAESVFRRLFIENVIQSTNRSSNRPSTFSFKYSAPLIEAISKARHNANELRVAVNLRGSEHKLGSEYELSLNLTPTDKGSISIWETQSDHQNSPVKDGLEHRRLHIQEPYGEIAHRIEDWNTRCSPGTLEVARIAIWPANFFDSDYAFRVIQFHEDCLVPLFWLNPNRLIPKKGPLKSRRQWGYAIVYAQKYKDPSLDGEEVEERRPSIFPNDEHGKVLTQVQPSHRHPGVPEAYDVALWGAGGAPVHYRRNSSYLSAEFSTLLRRPDILFAADAYALHRLDSLDSANDFMSEQYGNCVNWLEM